MLPTVTKEDLIAAKDRESQAIERLRLSDVDLRCSPTRDIVTRDIELRLARTAARLASDAYISLLGRYIEQLEQPVIDHLES